MMEIITDEREWAQNALSARDLGQKPAQTLYHIARYYKQGCGYNNRDVRELLEQHIIRCDPNANLFWWSDCLDRVVKESGKKPLIKVDGITLYKSELDCISKTGAIQAQRIAFVMLCLAKYWNAIRGIDENNNWVNADPSDIAKMANVSTSTERVNDIYRKMKDKEYIVFSKRVDSLNCRVLPVATSGDECLYITDFRNLGYQYMMFVGKDYFPCESCGLVVKRRSPAHKYCQKCAGDIHIRQSANSVMKQRQSLYGNIRS